MIVLAIPSNSVLTHKGSVEVPSTPDHPRQGSPVLASTPERQV
jgi:hypothetical protein